MSGYRNMKHRRLGGLAGRLLTAAEFRFKRSMRRYDLELRNIAGEPPPLGLKAPNVTPFYHGMELIGGYVKPERGFVATPNMLSHATKDSVLLPRPVNLELFRSGRASEPIEQGKIRVGHFWRRGSINGDYAFRYFKGTDLVEKALDLLERKDVDVDYVDHLVPRSEVPKVISKLDVVADQFVMGIYGIPAVEALLMGVPVVGYYQKDLCECQAVYDQLTKVDRTPESIARGILQASKTRASIDTKEIASFHSPRNSVEIFLDAAKKWRLI